VDGARLAALSTETFSTLCVEFSTRPHDVVSRINLVATLFVVMYVALVLGVFRLRSKEPEAERPFRAWGFPYTGIICGIGWTAIALFVAATSLDSTIFGAVLILIAVPIYHLLKRIRHLGDTIPP
jgi:amino acid transporter